MHLRGQIQERGSISPQSVAGPLGQLPAQRNPGGGSIDETGRDIEGAREQCLGGFAGRRRGHRLLGLAQQVARLGRRLGRARGKPRRSGSEVGLCPGHLEEPLHLALVAFVLTKEARQRPHRFRGPPAPQRQPGADEPQVGPGRFERERLPQRLVGALRLQESPVGREQRAELAPGRRLRRRELHQDAQLARGLVDAAQVLQRAGAQPARGAPAAVRGAERLGRGQRRAGVPAPQVLFGV